MCGLVALLDGRALSDPLACVEAALQSMAHRGLPGRMAIAEGGRGTWLGHVRLPIVGTDRKYDQPWKEDDCTLAFVGELHNFKEVSPTAKCDVQVVVPLWRAALHNAWPALDGFFQFALVDNKLGVAVLAVDHLAIKPLYVRIADGLLAAASEIDALKAFGPVTLNQVYLSNVRKWGYDPTGLTPYNEIQPLPAGHLMGVSLNEQRSLSCKHYFGLRPEKVDAQEIRRRIETAVRNRLVSDVPIATLVSGGLDSAIVFLLAAKMGADVQAFHVPNDEKDYAELVAQAGGFELRDAPSYGGWEDMGRAAMQEPVDLGSVYPQLCLGMAVKEMGFRVCLSGDGADELFGGYRRAKEYDSQVSDVFVELPRYHLPRLDRTMMASTVELRSPFLAPAVVRAALGLPWAARTEKQMLKAAFADLVPKAVLHREKKALRSHDPYEQKIRNALVDDFIRKHNAG